MILSLAILLVARSVEAQSFPDNLPVRHPRIWWTQERLAQARQWWADPRNQFTPRADDGIGNAFVYMMTGDTENASAAIDWMLSYNREGLISQNEARWVGEQCILIYDWLYDLLTGEQRRATFDKWNEYVDHFNHQSWGGPGMDTNNYYWGFLRNSFLWAVTTRWEPGDRSDEFLEDALVRRWRDSFLPFAQENPGGIPDEGSAYGGLMLRYPVVPFDTASLYGRNMLDETGFFKEAVLYVIYATSPDATYWRADSEHPSGHVLFPFGDHEDYYRGWNLDIPYTYADFMTLAANHWRGVAVGQYARRWLHEVQPGVTHFLRATDAGVGDDGRDLGCLPYDYYAPGGSSYLYTRNQWGPQATSILLQLRTPPGAHHQHLDSGTWQLWRNGRWLSRESVGYGWGGGEFVPDHSGEGRAEAENTIAHNGLLFGGEGQARFYQRGPGEVRRLESRAEGSYADVDNTDMYRDTREDHRYDNANVGHAEREFVFLRGLETLVIFDRVESTSEVGPAESVTKTFLAHFQTMPRQDRPNSFLSMNGPEAVRVTTLVPANPSYRVIDERGREEDGRPRQDGQVRLQVDTSGEALSCFLHVVQGRDASAPDLEVALSEDEGSYSVTLRDPSTGRGARVVFGKGRVESGGGFACSPSGVPDQVIPFLDRVEQIHVTDGGPRWELGNFPACDGGSGTGTPMIVSDEETLVSSKRRHTLGLDYWPDGNLGIKRISEGDDLFFCANGRNLGGGGDEDGGLLGVIAKTEGTLDDPVGIEVHNPVIAVQDTPKGYGYAGGGQVYCVPGEGSKGMMLMIYHSEQYPEGNEQDYYSALNLAVSRDDGDSWTHLGVIVTPNISYEKWSAQKDRTSIDILGGTFTVVEEKGVRYFYVYFADDSQGGPVFVARAPVDDVVEAARKGEVSQWTKYYAKEWNEPGVGGRSTRLFTRPEDETHWPYWIGVSYNAYLGRYLMASCTSRESSSERVSTQLRLSESEDGIAWSESRLVAETTPTSKNPDAAELMYPTIVGLGSDPFISERRFAIYYVRSELGGWESPEDAELMRRIVTLK